MTERDYEQVPTDDRSPDDLHRAPSLVLVNTGRDKRQKHRRVRGRHPLGRQRLARRRRPVPQVRHLANGRREGLPATRRRLVGDGRRITWDSADLTIDQAVAAGAWQHAKALTDHGDHTLVMLDEITYPLKWGWIDLDAVVRTITDRPAHVNVVCTGRDAPQALIDIAASSPR